MRACKNVVALALIAAVGVGVPGVAGADPAATSTVAGTGIPAGATAIGTVAGSEQETFQLWLAPADAAGATSFADAVSTPGSSSFHQYLSPDQYTAQFGPTAAEASAVASWLSSAGFTAVQTSGQRDYVSATGSAAQVDQAFAVQMTSYQTTGPDGKPIEIQANNTDVSVPSSIASDVLSVTGLNSTPVNPADTSAPTSTATPNCSQYWAQKSHAVRPTFHGITKSPIGVCGYSAAQLRAVYGQTTANSGSGQTVAMIELGGPTAMFQTLGDYATSNGLKAPKSTQYREEIIGQGSACGNPYDGEEQLDSEAVYAMAPSADQLMVDGDTCNKQAGGVQPLFDAQTTVLGGDGSSPQATIVSNSYSIANELTPGNTAVTEHAILLRAADEGVGMYFSSGDSPGLLEPAEDPYATAVGGTTLGIDAQNNRLFETGWSNFTAEKENGQWSGVGGGDFLAAGGGTSLLWSQPAYQAGVVPDSMSTVPTNGAVDRAVPDIAADADPFSGFLEGMIEPGDNGQPGPYTTKVNGGTSLACPLVAAMVADAQQGQSAPFGFINPLLYSLSGSQAFNDVLPLGKSTPAQDASVFEPGGLSIFSEATLSLLNDQNRYRTNQVTAPGYDTMTGLGTPDGQAFIQALRSGK